MKRFFLSAVLVLPIQAHALEGQTLVAKNYTKADYEQIFLTNDMPVPESFYKKPARPC
jgi:hypothetical protein